MYGYCENNPIKNDDANGAYTMPRNLIRDGVMNGIIGIFLVFVVAAEGIKSSLSAVGNAITGALEDAGRNVLTPELPQSNGTNDILLDKAFVSASLADAVIYYAKAQGNKYDKKTETHHIIAQSAASAEPARKIWKGCNFKINDQENKVELPMMVHKPLHTQVYYHTINFEVIAANEIGGCSLVKETVKGIGYELGLFGALFP